MASRIALVVILVISVINRDFGTTSLLFTSSNIKLLAFLFASWTPESDRRPLRSSWKVWSIGDHKLARSDCATDYTYMEYRIKEYFDIRYSPQFRGDSTSFILLQQSAYKAKCTVVNFGATRCHQLVGISLGALMPWKCIPVWGLQVRMGELRQMSHNFPRSVSLLDALQGFASNNPQWGSKPHHPLPAASTGVDEPQMWQAGEFVIVVFLEKEHNWKISGWVRKFMATVLKRKWGTHRVVKAAESIHICLHCTSSIYL